MQQSQRRLLFYVSRCGRCLGAHAHTHDRWKRLLRIILRRSSALAGVSVPRPRRGREGDWGAMLLVAAQRVMGEFAGMLQCETSALVSRRRWLRMGNSFLHGALLRKNHDVILCAHRMHTFAPKHPHTLVTHGSHTALCFAASLLLFSW